MSHSESSPSDATHTASSGTQAAREFGAYRLLQKVGEGGMGEVWLAEQTRPVQRTVALKIIKAGMDTAQVVGRFEAERQALALMDHPAIATVFDGGSTPEGRPYFAMEYVKGEPITTYCDRQRLATKERLELFMLVCEGVQHAHQKGIIHRDLKPSNVLVTLRDGKPVPKIIDFGVAKATTRHLTERTLFTELGAMIGTPEYMSPEQADLTGFDIDTRTDVYALGVLLYELLTGTLPFERTMLVQQGLEAIRRAIREVDPPRPSTRITQQGPASSAAAKNRHTEPGRLASQLRGDLDWITMKALEKDRTRRYESATGLASDVRRHLANEPVAAGPPSAAYRTQKFVRRHRFGVAVAAMLVVLLAAFAVTMGVLAQRIARERDRANAEAERASREAATATAVADFLTSLFRVSDPTRAQGRTISVREVLDAGVANIDVALASDPLLQGRLLMTLSEVYRNLGVLDRAEVLGRRSAEGLRARLGPNAPETLRASSMLGQVYASRGKFVEAQQLLESVLRNERQTLGADHPNTLKTLTTLANVYDDQGHTDRFETLHREVLERRRRILGPDHIDTLKTEYDLAVAAYKTDRFADAERILTRIAPAFSRAAGELHPDTLVAKDLLGNVYRKQDRLSDAARVFTEVYQARLRVLGPDHMDTLATQLALGNLAQEANRFDEAEALYRKTLTAQERLLGRTHMDAIATSASLATLLVTTGRLDEGERTWRDMLSRVEQAVGRDHPTTAYAFVGLAKIAALRGRQRAALDLLSRAVRVDPAWAGRLMRQPEFKIFQGNLEFQALVKKELKSP